MASQLGWGLGLQPDLSLSEKNFQSDSRLSAAPLPSAPEPKAGAEAADLNGAGEQKRKNENDRSLSSTIPLPKKSISREESIELEKTAYLSGYEEDQLHKQSEKDCFVIYLDHNRPGKPVLIDFQDPYDPRIKSIFQQLPPEIQQHFNNDPNRLYDFLSKPNDDLPSVIEKLVNGCGVKGGR